MPAPAVCRPGLTPGRTAAQGLGSSRWGAAAGMEQREGQTSISYILRFRGAGLGLGGCAPSATCCSCVAASAMPRNCRAERPGAGAGRLVGRRWANGYKGQRPVLVGRPAPSGCGCGASPGSDSFTGPRQPWQCAAACTNSWAAGRQGAGAPPLQERCDGVATSAGHPSRQLGTASSAGGGAGATASLKAEAPLQGRRALQSPAVACDDRRWQNHTTAASRRSEHAPPSLPGWRRCAGHEPAHSRSAAWSQ